MQALIEELKKRAEKLKEQAQAVVSKPFEVNVEKQNYKEVRDQLIEELEGIKDMLQLRVDDLSTAISKIEDEQKPVEDVLDSVKDLLESLDSMPDES